MSERLGLTLAQVVASPRREARCMACGTVFVPGYALPWFRTGETILWGWLCRSCLGEQTNRPEAVPLPTAREPLPEAKSKEPEPAPVPESAPQLALFEDISPAEG
jgi:hypothetical protein